MAKWVLDTFEGTKVWYSGDVIERIKQFIQCRCNSCIKILNTGHTCKKCDWYKLNKIIEREDK